MATEVLVPKLGMTMTVGIVAEWRVADGGTVQKGESVYRLETEKIEFEVEAESDGIVRHLVPKGTKLPPGALVAYILAPGEPLPAGVTTPAAAVPVAPGPAGPAPQGRTGARVPASPVARRLAAEAGIDLAAITGTGPGGRVTEDDVLRAKAAPPPEAAPAGPDGAGGPASPIARRLASALGVDLSRVRGTGPGGRITKEDVEAAAAAGPAPAVAGVASAAAGAVHRPGEVVPLRAMRRTIAQRMHASLQEMAQLTMGMQVTMTEVVKLRAQLIDEWASEGIRPSFTDIVIKAAGKALRAHPLLNAQMSDEAIELLADVHVGMAVALDDGLVVPVIRHADSLPLKELAKETTRLADAARAGRLTLDEMAGGTFSVTALGSSGVDFFTPIINPPNVAILGVGRIYDDVKWEGDRPARAQRMTLSLTIDHRAVDGAPGAAFLGSVRELLEAPYRLLV